MKKGFFDLLEDNVRGFLSHFPIPYAFIGAIGVVLFWRGVWHTADYLMLRLRFMNASSSSIDLSNEIWWDGPLSLLVASIILLITGLFVSNFIGNEIIISGLKGEKKISEKTETEVKTEVSTINQIKKELDQVAKNINKSVK